MLSYVSFIHVLYLILVSVPKSIPHRVKFRYPNLQNVSSEELTLTSKNRCTFYPRCLLFSCCNDKLINYVNSYFNNLYGVAGLSQYHCSSNNTSGYCSLNSNLTSRLLQIWMVNEIITDKSWQTALLELPPTTPHDFKKLSRRCTFKVLYLITYKIKSEIYSHLLKLGDTIYLSYHERNIGILKFTSFGL